MLLVVLLVSILNNDSNSSSPSITTIATIAYTENNSDSIWDKFEGALLNSLVFVAVVTVVTFLLVLLFYFRCTKFLKYYMGFSSFLVLGFMGGEIALFLNQYFSFPADCFTFLLILFNFTVVGVLAVFMSKMAIFVTQGYLVVIGMLVAYWFTLLPEWTTWMLLVAMSLYDLAAVLLPYGPLRLLVELAMSRDEDIPALVYEARPVTVNDSAPNSDATRRRLWRETRSVNFNLNENSNTGPNLNMNDSSVSGLNSSGGTFFFNGSSQDESNLVSAEEGQVSGGISELTAPLIGRRINAQMHLAQEVVPTENLVLEGIGLGSSGAIKLGLGDFIFYSVLVGRAAMYDFMTVYACYLAIIAGLGITLVFLAFYQKALPALPVSVLLVASNMMEHESKYRIPSSVFARTKSNALVDWSVASNESLFSIQMGNMSSIKEDFFWKSGELGMKFGELGMKSGELEMRYGELGMRPGDLDMKSGELGMRPGELVTPAEPSTSVQMFSYSQTLNTETTDLGKRSELGVAVETMKEVLRECADDQKEEKLVSGGRITRNSDGSTSTKSFAFSAFVEKNNSLAIGSGSKLDAEKSMQKVKSQSNTTQEQEPKSPAAATPEVAKIGWFSWFSCRPFC